MRDLSLSLICLFVCLFSTFFILVWTPGYLFYSLGHNRTLFCSNCSSFGHGKLFSWSLCPFRLPSSLFCLVFGNSSLLSGTAGSSLIFFFLMWLCNAVCPFCSSDRSYAWWSASEGFGLTSADQFTSPL